ncbi:hypothetical protein F0562_035570 [Nyssa sinensis]|uniref:Peptidase A1 domain-containing protein n=1 Tax=Nyssa sinensis TaxID=561372 RepID=A0A5J5AD85_9ASTE|nr:hypothetical protein F0562_035570 [Nyssa sinensis]
MTIASESAFSTGGRLMSSHCSRLYPKTLEALICGVRVQGGDGDGVRRGWGDSPSPHSQGTGQAKMAGFSVDLIHRDSKLSPFYNPSSTRSERARDDALRSIARANRFNPSNFNEPNNIVSGVNPDGGTRTYFMKFAIGTPPVEIFAIADTGSDLIWSQCKPCNQCFTQILPLFDPSNSVTYKNLPCHTKPCQSLILTPCPTQKDECPYYYSYNDRSYTKGLLATDTFTFDSTGRSGVASFPEIVFGCGYDNGGTLFSTGQASGIVGLAAGQLSLVSQLSTEIEKKFSYCLLPDTATSASKLRFGADSVLSGEGIVSTPLTLKQTINTSALFYYLNLEAVSVGGMRIKNTLVAPNGGNIIIDSGTTLNFLNIPLYNEVAAVITEIINLNPVQDPRGVYSLCFDKISFRMVPEVNIVYHFTGADVAWKPLNTFIELDVVTCLMILPTQGVNFYGNVAQVNFQVEYDLTRMMLSFAAADCSQH